MRYFTFREQCFAFSVETGRALGSTLADTIFKASIFKPVFFIFFINYWWWGLWRGLAPFPDNK